MRNKRIALAGIGDVNGIMGELRLPHTRLRHKMMDSAAMARGGGNVSTPEEMARVAETIYRGKVDEAASRGTVEILKKVEGGIHEGLPLDIETASKKGRSCPARAARLAPYFWRGGCSY